MGTTKTRTISDLKVKEPNNHEKMIEIARRARAAVAACKRKKVPEIDLNTAPVIYEYSPTFQIRRYIDLDGKKVIRPYHKYHTDKDFKKGKDKKHFIPMYKDARLELAQPGQTVYIVEGEKDVDTLNNYEQIAVCCAFGASVSNWNPAYNKKFEGKNVAFIQDNDEPGKKFAIGIVNQLVGVAESVKLIDLEKEWGQLPEHADITDVFEMELKSGKTADDILLRLDSFVIATPEYKPAAAVAMPASTAPAVAQKALLSSKPDRPKYKIIHITEHPIATATATEQKKQAKERTNFVKMNRPFQSFFKEINKLTNEYGTTIHLIEQLEAKYTPFVVCSNFNGKEWDWGSYFDNLDDAKAYFSKKALNNDFLTNVYEAVPIAQS